MLIYLEEGVETRREKILSKLVEIQYERNDADFHRGRSARGEMIEIFPASSEAKSVRIELFGDVVDAIHEIDPLTGKSLGKLPRSRSIRTPITSLPPTAMNGPLPVLRKNSMNACVFQEGGTPAGGPAHRAAYEIRPGDDSSHGLLPWDRELLTPSQWAKVG